MGDPGPESHDFTEPTQTTRLTRPLLGLATLCRATPSRYSHRPGESPSQEWGGDPAGVAEASSGGRTDRGAATPRTAPVGTRGPRLGRGRSRGPRTGRRPAVVVLGGISAHRHLCPTPTDPGEGWWPGMVGPGLPVDTDRYRAIGIDFAGAPGTTCPCGRITTVDQARLVMAALDDLGVDRSTIVGSSYGGMVALAAAGRWPERITGLVIACAAHRPHPMATALRGLQREIVERGRARGDAKWGLIIARALAMTTYRSADEFEARFGSSATWGSGRPTFPVEEYLRARGEAFSARFDPESFCDFRSRSTATTSIRGRSEPRPP